jgi:hypothetical protein
MPRNTTLIVIFLLFMASAQANPITAEQSANSSSQTMGADTSLQPLSFPKDVSVLAKLLTDVDASSAKPGDAVRAEVIEDLKSGHQFLLQKGSLLSGHVVDVEQFSSESPKSTLVILFDQVTLKNGEQRSSNIGIQAIAPAEGTRTDAEVNPSIHVHDMKGTVGPLDHKSVGAYGMPGVSLAYVATKKKGNASLIKFATGNVRLKKGMQVVFSTMGQTEQS